MLEYLSRYTHRTANGNERIRAITDTDVVFSVRANDKGGKRVIRLDGGEFIYAPNRFCKRPRLRA